MNAFLDRESSAWERFLRKVHFLRRFFQNVRFLRPARNESEFATTCAECKTRKLFPETVKLRNYSKMEYPGILRNIYTWFNLKKNIIKVSWSFCIFLLTIDYYHSTNSFHQYYRYRFMYHFRPSLSIIYMGQFWNMACLEFCPK